MSLGDAWRQVLDVTDEEEWIVLKRMAAVYKLPGQIRHEASLLETIDPTPVLEAIPNVEQVIKAWTPGSMKVEAFKNSLGEGNLKALEMGSSALSKQRPQPTVSDEELQTISDAITDLEGEVSNSNLSETAKEELDAIVAELREAVEQHDIAGSTPLRHAAERGVGVLVTNSELREEVESESGSSVAKKLGELIYRVLLILNLAAGPLSIPASVEYWADNVITIEQPAEDIQGEESQGDESEGDESEGDEADQSEDDESQERKEAHS